MTDTEAILRDMRDAGLGDYTMAPWDTQEQMADAFVSLCFAEQARYNSEDAIARRVASGIKTCTEKMRSGTATGIDLMFLVEQGAISDEDRDAYYDAHGWTHRKFG